ncbi:hypothetical protein [Vulcanisaeta souniana]|uniref:Uncharacterized protein n=1 Tax=Vulcanisaeta souniana JCM 11219 TaxID=1293586 RepID=A0A830EG05_9CREN|nr:hypothetical protein [Vulcanisaeta souniana]BDR92118.1 hypothetical protein Vsou_12110 [Vulcanisaeta souniana JCM 11219]GGI67777.1 hypothetical protein GCM10007112_00970 [Vulcanisaeta souniana JCM 11219]
MTKIVHVRRFIPLSASVGQMTRGVELDVALNRLDESLNKALRELDSMVGSHGVRQVGINVSNVNLGNVSGILIIAYALVDADDETSKGGG